MPYKKKTTTDCEIKINRGSYKKLQKKEWQNKRVKKREKESDTERERSQKDRKRNPNV